MFVIYTRSTVVLMVSPDSLSNNPADHGPTPAELRRRRLPLACRLCRPILKNCPTEGYQRRLVVEVTATPRRCRADGKGDSIPARLVAVDPDAASLRATLEGGAGYAVKLPIRAEPSSSVTASTGHGFDPAKPPTSGPS